MVYRDEGAVESRTAFRLAWGACALTLALILGASLLDVLGPSGLAGLSFPLVGASGAVVGGLVASRRPANPVGWLFAGAALVGAFQALMREYAVYGLLSYPGSLPLAPAAAWVSHATGLVGPVLGFVLLPLYFPNGELVSPRWRVVVWISVGLLPLVSVLLAFAPGEAVYDTGIPNPLAVEALGPLASAVRPAIFASYIGLIFVSAASLIVRFWRSTGVERLQIKWFTFAAAFIPIWFMTNRPVETAFPILFQLLDGLVIAAVPVAAGFAILRYRLYDIDLIINRALVYGSLTVALLLTYFGCVVTLQYVFQLLTGEKTPLAVVASTLAIAALFNPFRRGLQAFVDRRFYRGKYDAARTLDAYAARLRDETDLGRLEADLVRVVEETVQPAHVSLWLVTPGTANGRGRDEPR